jgi:hypothetical protein
MAARHLAQDHKTKPKKRRGRSLLAPTIGMAVVAFSLLACSTMGTICPSCDAGDNQGQPDGGADGG